MTGSWHGSSDEVQVLVDDLAETLGRSVVINDPLVRMMYTSRHFHDEDPVRVRAVLQRDAGAEVVAFVLAQGVAGWSRPGMLPAGPEIQLLPRLCVPLRDARALLALLMVIDAEGTLDAEDLARIEETSRALTALLSARADAGDATRAAREQALHALLGQDPAAREIGLAHLIAEGTRDRDHAVVTTMEVSAEDRTASQVSLALRTALGPLESPTRGAALVALEGPRARLLQLGHSRPDGDQLTAQGRSLAEAVARSLGTATRTCVGIGGVAAGLSGAWRSARTAELALRGARLLPRFDGVAPWDRLDEYAVLLHLPPEALTLDLAPPALHALLTHDAGPRLLETLRVYLDEAGSAPRASARLHLHRTSLYYRLHQITEVTGLDLDDGAHRLVLHQGLRLLDLLDEP